MAKRTPRVPRASKSSTSAAPPYDLDAVKDANRKHTWNRYGKPVAPRFLPDELQQLNALREFFDDGPNLSDAGIVKMCFKLAVMQLLQQKPIKGHFRKW